MSWLHLPPSSRSITCPRTVTSITSAPRRYLSTPAARLSSTSTGASKGTQADKPSESQTSLVSEASKLLDTFPSHELDYGARIDSATSNFSPVPKRVMDGSEQGEVVAAAVLSGAPVDLQARQVRIYRPAKTATQSGTWHAHHWRLDWDILQKGHRWENPLMGWQSSADSMQGTHVNFKTKDEAIHFAEKQGYEYFVQEPNERRFAPKAYAANFMHEPKKLKYIKTK